MLSSQQKGNIGELRIAAKLIELGYEVLKGFGETKDFDLVAYKDSKFIRIQVKAVTPKNQVLVGKTFTSNSKGIRFFNKEVVDVLAIYDLENCNSYFVNPKEINGQGILLRLAETRNGQKLNIKMAKDYTDFPPK